MSTAPALPETAAVHWRPRADARRLRARGRTWTLTTVAHTVPFIATAGGLFALEPLSFPVGLAALAHAWAIPELYARRGSNVVRPRPRAEAGAEQVALGLLGDLVGHDARELHARTGLVPERGALGVWLVAEAGAVLVAPAAGGCSAGACRCPSPACPRPTASPTCCWRCAPTRRASPPWRTSPSAARPWRLRRRMPPRARPALDAGRPYGPRVEAARCEDGVNGPCPIRAFGPIMLPMPSTSAARRLILVPAAASPRAKAPTPGVRRFRLAQLRLEGRDVARSERFTHLKRSYD